MSLLNLTKTSAVACAIVLAPAFCAAAGPNVTVPGVPDSYMWGDSHTASALLQDMQRDASKIANEASALEADAGAPEAPMQQIEAETDHLNRQFHRLDRIRKEIVPAGQAAIGRAAPSVEKITQDASVADRYVRDGQQSATAYQSALQNLEMQASALAEEIGPDVNQERTQNEQMYLAKNAASLQRNIGMTLVFGK